MNYLLVFSLCLQSCNKFSNQFISIDASASTKHVNNKQLIDQGSALEKDLSNIYEENRDLQTDARLNLTLRHNTRYSSLGVSRAFSMNVLAFADVEGRNQNGPVQLTLLKGQQPSSISIGNREPSKDVIEIETKQIEDQERSKKWTGSLIGQYTADLMQFLFQVSQHLCIISLPAEEKIDATILGDFDAFPLEVLQMILCYIKYPAILNCIQINHFFYNLVTGYEQVGLKGIANEPSYFFYSDSWIYDKWIDFTKGKFKRLTPKNIPSFFFYRLVGKVSNLSRSFWPYLQGTKVHAIDLSWSDIGDLGAIEFVKNLQGTSVHTVDLSWSDIGDSGAIEFAKNLQRTSVHTVNLAYNQIGASGAAKFAKNLQGTNVQIVNLRDNNIGNLGALGAAEFAKNLQRTSVQVINLRCNQIGALGTAEFARNLQGTNIQVINLRNNQIGASGAAELAKNLQKTSIQVINLRCNQIGPSGATEFAKNLQGTNVQEIDLSNNEIGPLGAVGVTKNLQGTKVKVVTLRNNQIGASGAAEFAKNLQGTNVQVLNLRNNKIGSLGAAKLVRNLRGINVKILNLRNNNIGSSGARKLAKNLQGTNVRTVDLSSNQVDPETQALLKRVYPNINWEF